MKVLYTLFLMGMVVCVYSETCPSPEKLWRCSCQDNNNRNIKVACGTFTGDKLPLETLKQALKQLAGKKNVEIELRNVKLGKMPANLFLGIEVVELHIYHCDLDSLTEGVKPPLTGLENSLKDLYIHNSIDGDDDLSQHRFGHLKKLESFGMYDNTIKVVSNKWFANGPASLEDIYLEDNKIERIEDRAFSDLPNLESLTLDENKIQSLECNMLPTSVRNLKTLYLNKNDLSSFPADIFSEMPNLKTVQLRQNKFTRLDQDTWEPVFEQLDYLDFKDNPLICDSRMKWMFNLRAPRNLQGTCAAPDSKKGTSLTDFIQNK